MTFNRTNQASAQQSAHADRERAREFATECWRRAVRRRLLAAKPAGA